VRRALKTLSKRKVRGAGKKGAAVVKARTRRVAARRGTVRQQVRKVA
jgi:hypothetical protein